MVLVAGGGKTLDITGCSTPICEALLNFIYTGVRSHVVCIFHLLYLFHCCSRAPLSPPSPPALTRSTLLTARPHCIPGGFHDTTNDLRIKRTIWKQVRSNRFSSA